MQAAGLADTNSVVICTEGGFRRVPLSEVGMGGTHADAPDNYADLCSLCVIALSAQVVLDPGFVFTLDANEHATRMSIRHSDRIFAAKSPT